jgi:group I intron endonuclease
MLRTCRWLGLNLKRSYIYKMGFIYKITNAVTGKCYIGETMRKDPRMRFRAHKNIIRRGGGCPALRDAFKKHGEENFTFEVLFECADDERFDKEKEMIQTYNSMVPNGYNILEGGQGCSGFKHSDETKARLSEVAKEQMKDPVRVEKLKDAHKKLWSDSERRKENIEKIRQGMLEYIKNKTDKGSAKMSDETKEKIRKSITEYFSDKNNTEKCKETRRKLSEAKYKSVIQYDREGNMIRKFKSMKEATELLDLPKGGISAAVRGKAKSCGGFVWKFET